MAEIASVPPPSLQPAVSKPKIKMGSGDVRTQTASGPVRMRQHANLDALRVILKRIRSGSVTKTAAKPTPKKRRASVIDAGLRPELVTISTPEKKLRLTVEEIPVEVPEPTAQKAFVVASKGEYEIRTDFPIPALGDNEVMIRSRYVGLNPIDWKSVDYNFCLPAFPWVTGREMSGIVEKVGKDVTGIAPGDKVWTSTYYKDVRAGCFQELVVVPTHTVAKIPHTIPFESAACLGVPALTACMTLWKWLNVRMPSQDLEMADVDDIEAAEPEAKATSEETSEQKSEAAAETEKPEAKAKATPADPTSESEDEEWLLIWGGSTSTGQFATQVASQAGLKVITVNSASTKPLSERLGASHVVVRDGKTDAEIVDAIKEATKGGHITRAIDLVGAKTAALVLQAVSAERPVHFAPLAFMSSSQAIPENVTAHTVEMKRFVLDESSRSYADELNALLEAEMLVLPDIHFLDGGFEIIQEGLEMLKRGDLKGKKLVVRM